MGKQKHRCVSIYVFLFLCLTSQIYCTSQQKLKEKDLIKILPGQPSVNFKQYGGYVPVNESDGRFFYYYFVEAIKANSSPLVIWFNGGPGCSSVKAAFEEHGPFRIHSDAKTLFHNPYSWNNEANMLYIDSPAEVGFSYINTLKMQYIQEEQGKMTTENNYVFLVKWLERFPEYKKREVYITGESYAGHYVPQLAQMIMHRNNQTFINLQGILIGNPSLDQKEELKGGDEFLEQRGLVPKKMLENRDKLCNFTNTLPDMNEKCTEVANQIDSLTKHLDLYNIYAPYKCENTTLTSKPKKHTSIINFDLCERYYLTVYLNKVKVQKAMHAGANVVKQPYKWLPCNMDLHNFWDEEDFDASMISILYELMRNGVRVFIYSGDLDSVVSVTSTMYVLKKMNLMVEKEWRPWFSEKEVGGFTEEYKGNFTFATVRGAGHYVPRDQPIRALTIFTSFIRNIPLP